LPDCLALWPDLAFLHLLGRAGLHTWRRHRTLLSGSTRLSGGGQANSQGQGDHRSHSIFHYHSSIGRGTTTPCPSVEQVDLRAVTQPSLKLNAAGAYRPDSKTAGENTQGMSTPAVAGRHAAKHPL
jgi:hypothetical protein